MLKRTCVLHYYLVILTAEPSQIWWTHWGPKGLCMGCCNTCSRRAVPPVCAFGPQQPTSQKTPLTTQTGPKLRRDRNTPVRPIKKKPFQGRTLYAPAIGRDGRPIFYDSDIEEEEVLPLSLKYEDRQVRDLTSQVNKWKELVHHAIKLSESGDCTEQPAVSHGVCYKVAGVHL